MLSRLLHGERLAVGENRAVETVLLVIGVDEEDGSLLYGVYDFTGTEILPVQYDWEYLYNEKFVTANKKA